MAKNVFIFFPHFIPIDPLKCCTSSDQSSYEQAFIKKYVYSGQALSSDRLYCRKAPPPPHHQTCLCVYGVMQNHGNSCNFSQNGPEMLLPPHRRSLSSLASTQAHLIFDCHGYGRFEYSAAASQYHTSEDGTGWSILHFPACPAPRPSEGGELKLYRQAQPAQPSVVGQGPAVSTV